MAEANFQVTTAVSADSLPVHKKPSLNSVVAETEHSVYTTSRDCDISQLEVSYTSPHSDEDVDINITITLDDVPIESRTEGAENPNGAENKTDESTDVKQHVGGEASYGGNYYVNDTKDTLENVTADANHDTNDNDTQGNDTNDNDKHGNDTNGDDKHGNDTNDNDTNGNDKHGNDTNGDDKHGNDTNDNDTNDNDTNGNDTNGDDKHGNDTNGNDTNGSADREMPDGTDERNVTHALSTSDSCNTSVTTKEDANASETDNTVSETKEVRIWTQEEIQSLLIKAINFKAATKDIKTIIGCGADVNKPINNGLHPLHYAAYTDNVECLVLLINSGANVNVTDDIGYTPLHLSARRGNYRSMEKLIENGAMVNFSEPGVEIHQTDEKNKLGYTTTEPLNLAIQNGHKDCARLLLENGARADNKYFMGFEICLAPLDQPDCLELLLKHGANPNVFNRCGLSPLMKACKDHHIEAARVLIKYGADVNAQCPPLFEQKSVLQFAIMSGNIVIINILLGKGAKISRQGEYKYSALHTAIIKGRSDICRLLLQQGADANERTDEGATPMMIACCTPEIKERKEIIQLLIDCGADVNLHSPCYSYFDPYLAPLTEYFKNIANSEGFSIVPLLIRHGAIVHFCSSGIDSELKRLRDPFSILPYAYCMTSNQEIFELLMNAANKFSPVMIHANEKLPEHMKDMLLYQATRPRELKHQVRVALRQLLAPGLPDKVRELPIPALLKSYLLFE